MPGETAAAAAAREKLAKVAEINAFIDTRLKVRALQASVFCRNAALTRKPVPSRAGGFGTCDRGA